MYGGFDVFKVYLAVKLHFTSNYNYFDYDGKVNCKLETFTKRNDRYFFHKLSKKYGKDEILVLNKETLNYMMSTFEFKKEVGMKLMSHFSYHFRNDFTNIVNDFSNKRISFDDGFRCSGGQHPRLLRLLIQRRTSFQSLIVLDQILSFVKNWNKEIKERVVWPKIALTMARLKPFINYNMTECKLIIKEVIKNA